ncbi:MAG: hypothetical protein ACRELD_05845 [Longimicrobiales bacterium]
MINEDRPWAGIFGRQPFDDSELWDTSPDGRAIYFVRRDVARSEDAASFTVTRFTPEGDTALHARYRYRPERLSDGDREHHVSRWVDHVLGARGPGISRPDRARAAVLEQLYLPEYLPPITAMFAGVGGQLWLRREEPVGREVVQWHVVGADGRVIAHAAVPVSVRLLFADDDHAYGTVTDELDVPYVVRYLISR